MMEEDLPTTSVMPPSEDTKKNFPYERDGVAFAFASNQGEPLRILRVPEYECTYHGMHEHWITFHYSKKKSWCIFCIIRALETLGVTTITHE